MGNQVRNAPAGSGFDTGSAPNLNNQVAHASGDRNQEITASSLAAAQPNEQKQMLGEKIYPLVSKLVGGDKAGKITGMLLEIDNDELLMMLESEKMLSEKVTEAVTVLAKHSGKPEDVPAQMAGVV